MYFVSHTCQAQVSSTKFRNHSSSHSVHWRSWGRRIAFSIQRRDDADAFKVISIFRNYSNRKCKKWTFQGFDWFGCAERSAFDGTARRRIFEYCHAIIERPCNTISPQRRYLRRRWGSLREYSGYQGTSRIYKLIFVFAQALPQFGILARAVVGLLILEGDAQAVSMSSRQPGSRLKTPALPIWVTSCCGHYGVLFNSNRELLRNYHAEKRFELHYYTCASCYLVMSVDNRSQDEPSNGGGGSSGGNNANSSNSANLLRDDVVASPLERLIHTKWAEAKVAIKGPIPASMANWY